MYKHLTGFFTKPFNWFDPLAEYLFQDNVIDTSGNGRDATAFNSPSYEAGPVDRAIILNGINQYVELPSLAAWKELNGVDFSCSFWFKTTDKSTTQHLIGNYATISVTPPIPNQWWAVQTESDGKADCRLRRDNNAETASAYGTADTANGIFHYFVYIKRGLDIENWIDNVHVDTGTLSQDGSTLNNQEVRMGVLLARFLACSLANCRLYDFALSTEQIDTLYNE